MHLDGHKDTFVSGSRFSFETIFVLFFLAVELGRIAIGLSFDVVLVGLTLTMVAVLPYFLYSHDDRPKMAKWLVGRSLVVVLGCALGVAVGQAVGTLLPDGVRFVPLSLLIIAGIASSILQFYGLMRLRLAK
jgi:hypothetical protein